MTSARERHVARRIHQCSWGTGGKCEDCGEHRRSLAMLPIGPEDSVALCFTCVVKTARYEYDHQYDWLTE